MTPNPTEEISKVLVVDDEENILKSISRLLIGESMEVLAASTVDQGLELLRMNPDVAVILSDQRMPKMTGAEFLQEARKITPNAVRMVLTGYADINATMDAINKGGASRYITKPWDDGMLVQAVNEGIDHYRIYAENVRLNALVKKQNEELQEWNTSLKSRVLAQTATIRKQIEGHRERNEELNRMNDQMVGNWQSILSAFSSVHELQDPILFSHSQSVGAIAEGAARDLGLPADAVETIKIAASLHDIGKIGASASLYKSKPKDMSADEQGEYRQHPERGEMLLSRVEILKESAKLVRHHHENFDGSGFPNGLRGDTIPRGARIIAFADQISYLCKFTLGNTVEQALSRVKEKLGTILDPALFSVFEKHARRYYQDTEDKGWIGNK